MKKSILMLGTALVLVGCNKESGGTSDQYGTDRGSSGTTTTRERGTSSMTNSALSTNSSSQGASGTIDTTTNSDLNRLSNTNRPGNP